MQEQRLVRVDAKQQRRVRDLDDEPVEADEAAEGHGEAQRGKQPGEDVAGRNVREERIRLDHGDGVDGEEELMLVVGVLSDGHERVCQHRDEDGDDEEVRDEQKGDERRAA